MVVDGAHAVPFDHPTRADERAGIRNDALRLGDRSRLGHRREHRRAPGTGLGLVLACVGGLGPSYQCREVRGLGQVDLGNIDAELGMRRSLNAVCPPAEVDRVQVTLEDLVLRQLALELHRDRSLSDLAPKRRFPPDVDVLDVLLGDRRATLAPTGVADVLEQGPGDPDRIDAAVFVETSILCGQHSIDDDFRYLREPDRLAVLAAVQRSQPLTVRRVDERGLQLEAVGRQRHRCDVQEHDADQPDTDQHRNEQQPPDPAPEPGRTLLPRRPPAVSWHGRGQGGTSAPDGSTGRTDRPRRRSRRSHPADGRNG